MSLAATVVFAARFVVKQWLYLADSTGWLAFATIAMGTPLTAFAMGRRSPRHVQWSRQAGYLLPLRK